MEGRDSVSPQAAESQASEAETGGAPRISDKLKLAVRRARLDDAERTRVVAELRGAEIARLEMLRDELSPILAEIPKDADLFDVALVASDKPRLFIDMIGFVEMGRDRRTYRFLQDTRHGRVLIAESERIEPMVESITDYIARRLIEREKALASDQTLDRAARAHADTQEAIAARRERFAVPAANAPRRRSVFVSTFAFLTEFLGAAALFAFVLLGGWTAWKYIATVLAARHGAPTP